MAKGRLIRVLTNRAFQDGKSFEVIERDGNGRFSWRGEDWSLPGQVLTFFFPVDELFVRERFQELGRTFLPESG